MNAMHYFALAFFLILVLGGGTLIGTMARPGDWYARLAKPSFNPPNWIFAPVWSLLYIFIAIAGWRTWEDDPFSAAMTFWFIQLALNFIWSPVFFRARSIGGALAIVAALLPTILGFIALRWTSDLAAALLFVPYGAWVAFATLLNASIWALNRARA
jgi:translocator protein